MSNVPSKSQLLIYQSDDGTIKIDVRFENETVWLTQPLMAELFQTTQQNISLHLQNIYEEGELGLEATHKKILSVRREGNREGLHGDKPQVFPPVLSGLPGAIGFRDWSHAV